MHLFIQPAESDSPSRVNLRELHEVRQHHMPTPAVRFAPAGELERVAAEVARQHPHYREEVYFVVQEELSRRAQLTVMEMHVLRDE